MHYCRANKLIILSVLLCAAVKLKAQEPLSSALVEERSYQLYVDKNWKELIPFVNTALKNDFDYYYLRIRLGIAYFEEQNYAAAEKNFDKALSFNSADPLAKEYLYYCYLYTGRYEEARNYSRKFDPELAQKTGTDSLPKVSFVILEGGVKISDTSAAFSPATYVHFGLGHYVMSRFSLFHAVTYFGQTDFRGKTNQFQYYIGAGIPVKKGWLITPSFHYISKSFTPDGVLPDTTMTGGRPPRPTKTEAIKFNYVVGSLAVQKTLAHWNFSLGTTLLKSDSIVEYHNSATVSHSFFKGNKLTLGCTGFLHSTDSYSSVQLSVSPFVVVRPLERFSLSLSYLSNSGANAIEANGYIVNNSPDLTTWRCSVIANVKLGPQLDVYALYQYENKKEFVQYFAYDYNTFVIGLKFSPIKK